VEPPSQRVVEAQSFEAFGQLLIGKLIKEIAEIRRGREHTVTRLSPALAAKDAAGCGQLECGRIMPVRVARQT